MADAPKAEKAKKTDAERLDILWDWMTQCKKQMWIVHDRLRMNEEAKDETGGS